jgi:hypothetical protein
MPRRNSIQNMRHELNKYIWILFIIVIIVATLPADSGQQADVVDVRPESRLQIRCFDDRISNGVQDINESGISGWTFEIQGPDNKYIINTDENGKADIWLHPGEYDIIETKRTGYAWNSPEKQTVALEAGQNHTIYFGNKLINTHIKTIIKTIDSRPPTGNNLTYSGYPQIILMPESQTFTDSDWQQEHGKRINIAVENPDYSKLYDANIKINISDGWDLIPNPEDSPICYISKEKTFWIHDFGNFTEKYASDWFELRPRKGIEPKQYFLNAEIVINYNHPDDEVTGSAIHESKSNKTISLLVIGSTNYLSILTNNFGWMIALIGLLFGTGLLRNYFKRKDI